ncbi:MAG: glycosyltransferase family 39 protein [Methanobrevibacter sp.]|jgi:hypothetical protein|nr:glycosyltransferase family 39 protein [Candidatus Methanovirga meridionalis]
MNILKKNLNFDEIIGIGLFILSIILLLVMLVLGLNQALWLDEVYTINLIALSFKLMLLTTAGDVHPPLYYIILKSISMILPHPVSLNIILYKLVSVVPLVLLLYFSLIKLRKDFGWLTAGIFGFCIITMPKMMIYGIQIRMYSWVMFFLTMSFYYFYKISKQPNNKNWIIFTIFSLLAAYTHYYGTIAIAFIYLFMILKNKNLIKTWILSSVTIVLFYIPWVFIFLKRTVFGDNQWHIPTFQDVIDVIGFIFSPHYHDYDMTELGILFFIIFIILIIYYIFQISKDKKNSSTLINEGFFILVVTTSFALLFSALIRPMFYAKYVFVVIGCFWLSFSILLSKIHLRRMIFVPILIFIIVIGLFNSVTFLSSENTSKIAELEFKNYLNQIGENDTIIYIGPHLMIKFFDFYLINKTFVVWTNSSSDIMNINEGLKKGKVWVFDNDANGFPELYGGLSLFNNTLIENGLKLDKIGEIKSIKYMTYPRYMYIVS